jgi:hypothetical protein
MGGQSRKGTGVHWSAVGQKRKCPGLRGMSASPSGADLIRLPAQVRSMPTGDFEMKETAKQGSLSECAFARRSRPTPRR